MSDFVYDRNAPISAVSLSVGFASFTAQGLDWTYYPGRGRLYANLDKEPVHETRDGSYCLTNGHTFGEVMANARLLGASVWRKR